jgi:ribosome recycling factor
MLKELFRQAEEKMHKAIEATEHEFNTIRTGRANPALLDAVQVNAYGTIMPLKQLATISSPDPRSLLIQPWDRSNIAAIEKSILAANLGLTPINDGRVIRINIPSLTEERRKELAKIAHRMAEEGRVAIRNVRRHTNDEIKKLQKDGKISEDENFKSQASMQETTDKFIEKVNTILAAKEKEIMEV